MNKFLKISLIVLMVSFGNCVLASDNVLQAIQVNGVKDSYNIILKSDDVAEVRKTVQAPNKMVLDLKGIRASKTINTIYNNTASIDSVVVEPVNDETVKIFVQGQNVANAQVHFDSLKTPLGVLGNSQSSQGKSNGEVVLSDPMTTYKPVYDDSNDEDESGFSFGEASGSFLGLAKNALQSDKLSWLVTGLLFAIVMTGGIKSIKGNDNDIKVGLSQSLKDREVNLYGGLTGLNVALPEPSLGANKPLQPNHLAGANFGLKAYQDGSRNPYVTSEVRPKAQSRPQSAFQPLKSAVSARQMGAQNSAMQSTIQKPTMATMASTATMTQQRTTQQRATQQRTSNIDSIKFLESMTKIYEKNGRSDLAQGLKTNMKKAKANLA